VVSCVSILKHISSISGAVCRAGYLVCFLWNASDAVVTVDGTHLVFVCAGDRKLMHI